MTNPSPPALVALGDIHLSDTIWRARPDITGDAILGLRNLVDQAVQLGVPAVIVGDLFDLAHQQDPRALAGFMVEMDRMKLADLEVWAIQGNHDKRQIPWYTLHPHVKHFGHGGPVRINGLDCRGLDYDLHQGIQESLSNLAGHLADQPEETPDCLFLHQAVRQSLRFEGAWNCDLEWVPERIPLVVLGDIHQEQEFLVRPGQRAYYTGSGHPRSVSELQDQRSILVVNRDLTVTRRPVPTRPIWAGTWLPGVAGEITGWLRDAWDRSVPSGLPPVLHLTFMKDHTPDLEAWLATLGKIPLVIRMPVAQQVESTHHQDQALATPEQLIGQFTQGDREAQRLALDLLQTRQSLTDVITQHRAQFLKGVP